MISSLKIAYLTFGFIIFDENLLTSFIVIVFYSAIQSLKNQSYICYFNLLARYLI